MSCSNGNNRYIPSSKKKEIYIPKHHHCSVIVGVQECGICYEKAYYSKNIYNRYNTKYPIMSLFRCGHGMCKDCTMSMIGEFKCPFCRDNGSIFLKTFGSNEYKGSNNTLCDFLEEWDGYYSRAMNSKHIFAELHKQIISDHKKKKAIENKKLIRDTKKKNKRNSRNNSRDKAICKICNRDTFTSEKQLAVHMSKKHKK